MNDANLDKLINHLEKMPREAFNMGAWVVGPLSGNWGEIDAFRPELAAEIIKTQEAADTHDCNTVACIGGYALMLAMAEDDKPTIDIAIQAGTNYAAGAWLGLDNNDAEDLFIPRLVDRDLDDITLDQALYVLRNLKKTGAVDWHVAGIEVQ